MTLDLNTIDPATIPASSELDQYIAEKWMGWKLKETYPSPGIIKTVWSGENAPERLHYTEWSPSTNPAHAGEARRKEIYHKVTHGWWEVCVEIGGKTQTNGYAEVAYVETDNDKGKAEALATCRAIVCAMKQ